MPTFVKATKIASGAGNNASGTVTGTAGNLWVGGGAGCSASSAPTFSGGGTWTQDTSGNYAGSFPARGSIDSAPGITGGSQTVTITATGASGTSGWVMEFSGCPTSSPLDGTAAAKTGTTTSAGTNSYTNVSASAAFVALVFDDSGNNPATFTGGGAVFTYNPNSVGETNGASLQVDSDAYVTVATAAARSASWTLDTSVSNWAALLACYKGTAVAANPEGWEAIYPDCVGDRRPVPVPY